MQLSLFDNPAVQTAPYIRGSSTSKAAAVAIGPTLSEKQKAVYEYIRSCGTFGTTDNELIPAIVKLHKMNFNTPRARRVELMEKGLIEKSGERKGCNVWVAKTSQ
jgi:hypothetical protein